MFEATGRLGRGQLFPRLRLRLQLQSTANNMSPAVCRRVGRLAGVAVNYRRCEQPPQLNTRRRRPRRGSINQAPSATGGGRRGRIIADDDERASSLRQTENQYCIESLSDWPISTCCASFFGLRGGFLWFGSAVHAVCESNFCNALTKNSLLASEANELKKRRNTRERD